MRKWMLAATVALAQLGPMAAWAEGAMHKIAFHVDQNDPQVMNMTLNNVANVTKYYTAQGDQVEIEVVAYGPGLHMYIEGKSPVADRIAAMSLENEHLKFSACGNTIAGMKKKTGADVPLLSEARVVPSGVVRLVELQEEGYAYVRP